MSKKKKVVEQKRNLVLEEMGKIQNMKDGEIFPVAVNDIDSWEYIITKRKQSYTVGSVSVDRYIRVEKPNLEAIMYAIRLMDGKHSVEDINQLLADNLKVRMNTKGLYIKLLKAGLIEGIQTEEDHSEISMMSIKLIHVKFKENNSASDKPWIVMWYLFTGVYIVSLFLFLYQYIFQHESFAQFLQKGYSFRGSSILGMVIAAGISIFSITFHEFSHATAAVRFGLQPTEFKMVLYGGYLPNWLLKIRGMYTANRKVRVAIMGAGLITNFSLMTISANIVIYLHPTEGVSEILAKVFLSNLYMIIIASSPMYLSDGYFICSQLLDVTNLRTRSIMCVVNLFRRKKKGKRESIFLYAYTFVMFYLIITGFYHTFQWCRNISLELYGMVNVVGVNYVVGAIPFVLYALLLGSFILRFAKMVQRNMEENK